MFDTKDKNFKSRQLNDHPLRREVLNTLPLKLRSIVQKIPQHQTADIEEIRLRVNRPLTIYKQNMDFQVSEKGFLLKNNTSGYMVTEDDMEKAFQLITDYSVYAFEDEIRNGFITIKGGHRVGICGRVVVSHNQIKTIKDISGLNIRISRQILGVSNNILKYLLNDHREFLNTLIISPPQCGKTTLLRDIVRNLSDGSDGLSGYKVGLVDERSEIAGCYQGIPQNDVGLRTDILDACPKAQGIIMLIRSMSPEIIATDEIGRKEDISAIEEALNAGIKLITTVHGKDLMEVSRRPILKQIIRQDIFERIIILTNNPKVGTIQDIYDISAKKSVYNTQR